MLGPNPRVDVQAGSAMPRSKAAKQAAMTEVLALMLQYGVPIDERNLRKFLKDYEVGGLDRLFEGFSEDAKQVNRENRQLIEGNVVPINSFDNHEFHIAEHTEFQKTHRYHYLPENTKAMFDLHVAEHRRYMMGIIERQVQTAAQEQMATQDREVALNEEQMAVEAELNNNGGKNDSSAA
jgi:ATP-dependent Lon protease